ncbi:MAG: hypothetical protein BGO01_00130 [Armatimonadetes bacterium 55-13]|nr:arginase family protein [Armatimonadota bacterium]OJU63108.1 MAG: hypothetical protein BGO01_00130 [Armatimonadetes bacterium 55-13]
MHEDVNWPRASAWLAGHAPGMTKGRLTVLGVPLNFSITPGNCDRAPRAIRESLVRFSTYAYEGADVRELIPDDRGDLTLFGGASDANGQIEEAVVQIKDRAVLLGGDNGLTRPAVKGLARSLGLGLDRIGLITIDAHHDLRELDGGPINGNPIRGLLADGLPGSNVIQIGIQSFANSPQYAAVAKQEGIKVVPRGEVRDGQLADVLKSFLLRMPRVDVVYIDIDLDAMDRAFAPGCPGARPGGFTPNDLREAAFEAGRNPKVRMIDLVELDPTKDINDVTAMAGAACMLSFAAGVRACL